MQDTGSTILIGYDGSDDADEAVRVAGRLLGARRAVIAYVWDSLAALLLRTDMDTLGGPCRSPRSCSTRRRPSRPRQLPGAARSSQPRRVEPLAVIARGKPKAWPTLLYLADQHDAAAIVVGSRGLGGVESALLESVSAGVLDHAHRPVLIAPPLDDAEPAGPVVAGYDGSEQADAAIEAAGRFSIREVLVQAVWLSSSEALRPAWSAWPARRPASSGRERSRSTPRSAWA